MLKRVVAVLALMIVLMGLVFADQSLLVRSIQTSSAEELAAICRAYGLDDSLAENELRSQLYEFFWCLALGSQFNLFFCQRINVKFFHLFSPRF